MSTDPFKKPLHVMADRPRADSLADEEIEAAVRDDPDAPPIIDEDWFASATLVMPQPKEQISIVSIATFWNISGNIRATRPASTRSCAP